MHPARTVGQYPDQFAAHRKVGWPGCPVFTEVFQTDRPGQFVSNQQRASPGRVGALYSVCGYRERRHTDARQAAYGLVFVPCTGHWQAQLQQILEDFPPTYPQVQFQKIRMITGDKTQCLAPFLVPVNIARGSLSRNLLRPGKQLSLFV